MTHSILSGSGLVAALIAFGVLVLVMVAIIVTANYSTRLGPR